MSPIARLFPFGLALLPALLVAACGADAPKPQTARSVRATPSSTSTDSSTSTAPSNDAASLNGKNDEPGKSAINIDPAILKACNLTVDSAHFAFDSARVRPEDDRTLGAVATCFATGPLKGRQLRLVGRADARGDSEYNIVLGQARADAILQFVNAKGLAKSQTASTSRGAMDATGTDDAGWLQDRRVDLVLGE
jgi:peptidoglycan-associated lipoprotein